MKESKSKKDCVELLRSDVKVVFGKISLLHVNTAFCGVAIDEDLKTEQTFRLGLLALAAKVECVKSLVFDMLNDIEKL